MHINIAHMLLKQSFPELGVLQNCFNEHQIKIPFETSENVLYKSCM